MMWVLLIIICLSLWLFHRSVERQRLIHDREDYLRFIEEAKKNGATEEDLKVYYNNLEKHFGGLE